MVGTGMRPSGPRPTSPPPSDAPFEEGASVRVRDMPPSRPSGFDAHAIYAVLTDEPFIRASLDSVYPFASAISVITARDRNWSGEKVEPDGTETSSHSHRKENSPT